MIIILVSNSHMSKDARLRKIYGKLDVFFYKLLYKIPIKLCSLSSSPSMNKVLYKGF